MWEGLFRALGYKHNVWPMQNLAESWPRWSHDADSAFILQARLLGTSGLLPAELTRLRPAARDSGAAGRASPQSVDGYVRKLWDCWWREREEFSDCILPRTVWKFHGLRPANHPQRRLALAAHWLASGNLIVKLESWCAAGLPDNALLDSLLEILQRRARRILVMALDVSFGAIEKAAAVAGRGADHGFGGQRGAALALDTRRRWQK